MNIAKELAFSTIVRDLLRSSSSWGEVVGHVVSACSTDRLWWGRLGPENSRLLAMIYNASFCRLRWRAVFCTIIIVGTKITVFTVWYSLYFLLNWLCIYKKITIVTPKCVLSCITSYKSVSKVRVKTSIPY